MAAKVIKENLKVHNIRLTWTGPVLISLKCTKYGYLRVAT